MFPANVQRRSLWWRIPLLHRCFQCFKNRIILPCTRGLGKSISYRKLLCSSSMSTATTITAPPHLPPPPVVAAAEGGLDPGDVDSTGDVDSDHKDSSDLVALKISLLGDYHIGKTSFLKKYVGREKGGGGGGGGEEEEGGDGLHVSGLNQMDKTQCVKGARIAYTIWEVEGFDTSQGHIPTACIDSVAMLFMFDLTSRCTLNSVIGWYQEARKWNQTAIPVLVGAKFDDFIQLPIDLQWTIATQARAYAKALNATLFFSSATYNINVNKIFKFITAKLFNLPWSPERNLTIGEPIIDF